MLFLWEERRTEHGNQHHGNHQQIRGDPRCRCLLKNVWEGFNNKYIPLVLLPVALVGVLWLNGWAVTPENVMAGICSAALAVYIHNTGKHIAELKPSDDEGADPDGNQG